MDICVPYRCSARAELDNIKDYSVTVFDTIESLGALQWDKHISPHNVLMQHDNLKMLEQIHAGTMQFRYVLVKHHDVTVAAMYFQVVMFHANQLINYFPEYKPGNRVMAAAEAVSEKLLNMVNVPLLVSGNVFMTGENGCYFNSDVDKTTRALLLRKAVDDIAKRDHVRAVLVSDLYEPKTEFDQPLKKNAYHEITVESDMSIKLREEWAGFDDYVAALSSKYRVRTKKAYSLCDEAGVEVRNLTADEIATYQDDIYNLYKNVMRNADFKLAELNKNFFAVQKQQLPANYNLYAYFIQGQIIGFISAYTFGKRMEVHYTGMDHERCKPIHLYQRMMYDMVKAGIEARVSQLHYGRTAPEIKSTIGAVPTPMYGYVKHFNPVFNYLFVRTYTANLKPKDYTFRNPFK